MKNQSIILNEENASKLRENIEVPIKKSILKEELKKKKKKKFLSFQLIINSLTISLSAVAVFFAIRAFLMIKKDENINDLDKNKDYDTKLNKFEILINENLKKIGKIENENKQYELNFLEHEKNLQKQKRVNFVKENNSFEDFYMKKMKEKIFFEFNFLKESNKINNQINQLVKSELEKFSPYNEKNQNLFLSKDLKIFNHFELFTTKGIVNKNTFKEKGKSCVIFKNIIYKVIIL